MLIFIILKWLSFKLQDIVICIGKYIYYHDITRLTANRDENSEENVVGQLKNENNKNKSSSQWKGKNNDYNK